ncbi:MAG TPA: hypothetical protein VFW87_18935 [Pirellulales bacterium]|nr:hypothetical protein [Pirellulales bacterium]
MRVRSFCLAPAMLVLSIATSKAQPTTAAGAKAPPAAGKAASRDPAADAARKRAILNSTQWRRAMFEFKEWLSAQKFYDAAQVEQLKRRFNERVAAMSADEVSYLLADMESKFQILDSKEAQEARAWVGSYLAVMSEKKRAEVMKKLPNPATMTAAQLRDEVQLIEQKRATIDQRDAAFQRSRQAQVSNQLAEDRTAQQNYINTRNAFPTSTYSPYRSGGSGQKPFADAHIGADMGFTIGPGGGVYMSFSPSSF